MSRPVVLKTDPDLVSLSEAHRALFDEAGFDVVERPCTTERELIEHGAAAAALMVVAEPITDRVLRALGSCRLVARFGAGLDNIDLDAATRCGVQVTYAPGVSVQEVSDHALAMLLALARRLPAFDAAVRTGRWGIPTDVQTPRRLRDQTVGVIGAGRIGLEFARKLLALGPRVLVHDPFIPQRRLLEAGLVPSGFDELLADSDHVSIHTFLSSATRHLISTRELALMRTSATLINVARGPIVDQAALTDALCSGRLAAAALDVFEDEPPGPQDPLLALPNVILSPHVAHLSVEAGDELVRTVAKDVIAVLQGRDPVFPANRLAA